MSDTAPRSETHQAAARFCGTDSELRSLWTQLEQQRRFRVEQLATLSASKQPTTPAGANDPQNAVTIALRAAATAVLIDIEDALLRIQQDRYGLCQGCGAAIAVERLQALPIISWCGLCPQPRDATGHITAEPRVPRDTQTDRDILDEWGLGSFPASDPPANW